MMIAWATEVASFFISRGLAFALLALIQVLPEFAVEAVITYEATTLAADKLALVTANFTGANRLLVGLFLPMVFFVYAYTGRQQGQTIDRVDLPATSSLEIVGLLIPTLYSFTFALRGSITLFDAAILTLMYLVYLGLTYRMPVEEEDEQSLPTVPRWILGQRPAVRKAVTSGLFLGGGVILFLSVEPFYHNTIALAMTLGVPAYFLFQWIAPLLSEFPELITVSYWAKTDRAQHGITNVVSSKINQWTVLIAMIPVVFALGTIHRGLGFQGALPLGNAQQIEVLLTAAQALFAVACLMTLRFRRWHAWALLLLWIVQAADPWLDPYLVAWLPSPMPAGLRSGALVREWFTWLYLVLAVAVTVKNRRQLAALAGVKEVWQEHLRPAAGRQDR